MSDENILLDLLLKPGNVGKLDEEERLLQPFIEEINMITNPPVQVFVRSVLFKASKFFWVYPSSVDDGFPPDTYMEGGNILFTKRMVKIALLLAACYGDGISGLDTKHSSSLYRDMVIAACLIHGVAKWEETDDAVRWESFYAYALDEFIKTKVEPLDQWLLENEESSSLYLSPELKNIILGMVHSHMGRFSPIPETYPSSIGAMIVHQAYFLAANLDLFTEDLWNQPIPIDYLEGNG